VFKVLVLCEVESFEAIIFNFGGVNFILIQSPQIAITATAIVPIAVNS
jgi:hypothetical protein